MYHREKHKRDHRARPIELYLMPGCAAYLRIGSIFIALKEKRIPAHRHPNSSLNSMDWVQRAFH